MRRHLARFFRAYVSVAHFDECKRGDKEIYFLPEQVSVFKMRN